MAIKNSLDSLETFKNTGTLDVQGLSKNGTTIQSGAAGTVTASEVVLVDSNKDIATFRNVTATTFIGNLTGNVTGNVTGAGVLDGLRLSVAAKTAGTTQTQAGATAITSDITIGTTGNANDGYLLPTMTAGKILIIHNASANAGKVYANGTETLNGTAGNAGSTALTASKTMLVMGTATGVSVSAVMM